MKFFKIKLIILLLLGCCIYSIYGKRDDPGLKWRVEGESWMEKHLGHLKQIQSASDLKRLKKPLQQDYQDLSDLLSRVYQDNKSGINSSMEGLSLQGVELQKEMERVLQIEGAKKILDQYQKTTMMKFVREMRQTRRALSSSGTEKKDSKSARRSTKKE